MESLSEIHRFSSYNNEDFMVFGDGMIMQTDFVTSYKYKRIFSELKSEDTEKISNAVIRFCSELTLEESPAKAIESQAFLKLFLKLYNNEKNSNIKGTSMFK